MLVGMIMLVVAMGIGIFSAVFPERAAKRWGRNFADLPTRTRIWYLRCTRIFGIVFAIVAALFLINAMKYSR
jgi:hypothetical protein